MEDRLAALPKGLRSSERQRYPTAFKASPPVKEPPLEWSFKRAQPILSSMPRHGDISDDYLICPLVIKDCTQVNTLSVYVQDHCKYRCAQLGPRSGCKVGAASNCHNRFFSNVSHSGEPMTPYVDEGYRFMDKLIHCSPRVGNAVEKRSIDLLRPTRECLNQIRGGGGFSPLRDDYDTFIYAVFTPDRLDADEVHPLLARKEQRRQGRSRKRQCSRSLSPLLSKPFHLPSRMR